MYSFRSIAPAVTKHALLTDDNGQRTMCHHKRAHPGMLESCHINETQFVTPREIICYVDLVPAVMEKRFMEVTESALVRTADKGSSDFLTRA
jgi:hypothetical protein